VFGRLSAIRCQRATNINLIGSEPALRVSTDKPTPAGRIRRGIDSFTFARGRMGCHRSSPVWDAVSMQIAGHAPYPSNRYILAGSQVCCRLMDYGRLGSSGLLVSKIGLGTNNFGGRTDLEQTRAVLDRALDQGITLLDTSDIYSGGKSEEFIGECLGGRRHDVVIATKFSLPTGESPYQRGTSRRYLTEAVERSLRRLKTDYIDLYQIHRPDPQTPIVETLQAMDDLVRQGKVRYIGHCNFTGWQIVDAQWTARTEHLVRPISSQNAYSMLDRSAQAEVLPAAAAMGLGLLPFYPLASGFLTGKYRKGALPEGARLTNAPARTSGHILTDRNFALLESFEAFARERGHTMTELAFAWLLSQPAIASVIAGATRPEQVDENAAAGHWRLTPTDMESISSLT
jgi:aryl-alcohol dehydrogenase-like predicted oxidoreductase